MRKKTVLLRGPVLTRSGYGEQARVALRSLRSREDLFDIYIHPLQWGQTGWLSETNSERLWIDQKIEKTISYIQNGGTFDISVQVTIPNEWENMALTNIGYTAGIETTKVAPDWIQKANEMTKVILVSNHSKNVFENTKYDGYIENVNPTTQEVERTPTQLETTVEMHAVNYPVKIYEDLEPLEMDLATPYNFACVAQFGPRKNLVNTIKWFIEEFHDDADVGLVVKTNVAKNCLVDREACEGRLRGIISEFPDKKCKVYLMHGDMTDKEMHALYVNEKITAALSLTHGEGFGLPLFEAAYTGVPVVATAWSGQLDFLCDEEGKENFYAVSFDLNPVSEEAVWDGVILKDSMWAFPRPQSAKSKMRECIDDAKSGKTEKYCQIASQLMERFSEEKMYKQFVDAMDVEDGFDVESWLDDLQIEEVE